MKKIVMVLMLLAMIPVGRLDAQEPPPQGQGCYLDDGQGCTVFYAADEGIALGGNNEDFWNPFTKMWFVPAETGSYGRMYVGFDDFSLQGGMNDQGLFFDGLAVKDVRVPVDPTKETYNGNLVDKAMAECATVDCVIDMINHYDMSGAWNGQFFFGDRTGDAAIIEPLNVIRKEGRYLLATNFFQSEVPAEERDQECWRYQAAHEQLEAADEFSVALFRDILDAVHQEETWGGTLYSTIYDLNAGLIYVYLFHDFEHEVVLNLADELAQGAHTYDIPALFPVNETYARWAELEGAELNDTIAARLADDVDPAVYENYVGWYPIPAEYGLMYTGAEVTTQDGKLYIHAVGDVKPPLELLPASETEFFYVNFDHAGEFTISFVEDGLIYRAAGMPELKLERE
ncbi:MAG TPA: hypothetical protein VHP83_16850 [Aggregatilineaceae bacterium]|nr:hypothetical protein [Aggregatilineaceae bacterium]